MRVKETKINVNAKAMSTAPTFLTAQWRYLAMLNYEVDAGLLHTFVPNGTELDRWQGRLFVSMVAFLFLDTRVRGVAIPFHRNFEEVNLRFYVRRVVGDEVRRGVVFIKEVVPRWAIATIARLVYNENYVSMPMRHLIVGQGVTRSGNRNTLVQTDAQHADAGAVAVEYGWRWHNRWNQIALTTSGEPAFAREGSEEQFITEHYWGYAAQRGGGCMEYRVEHPPWRVWPAATATFDGDMEELYGRELAAVLKAKPASAFLAEGSEVAVLQGTRL
jgi:uncharacterized protein